MSLIDDGTLAALATLVIVSSISSNPTLLSLAEIYFLSPSKGESINSLKIRFSLAPDEGYSVYRGKNKFLDFWEKKIWKVFWVWVEERGY